MRRLIFYGLMIFSGYFLQTGVFSEWTLGGISPNLFVICAVSIGMIRGKKEGCIVGFIFGILTDALYAVTFGFYALLLALLGYAAGYVQQIFYEEDMTLPLAIISLADFLYGLTIYVFTFLPRGKTDFIYYIAHIILPEVIYTLILAVFVYRLITFINRRIEIKGSENRIDKKII